jgi:SagB-type dehydrogenase family enzyme
VTSDDQPSMAPRQVPRPGPTSFAMLRSFAYGHDPLDSVSDTSSIDFVDPIDFAEQFHEASKLDASFSVQMFGPGGPHFRSDPAVAFRLGSKSLAHTGPAVALPPPSSLPVDLAEITQNRRSELPPRSAPITLAELATLLALAAGRSPEQPGLRVTPSAGALYPLDIAVVVSQVEDLRPGTYIYDTADHSLLPRLDVDVTQLHLRAAIGEPIPTSSVTLALVATFARTRTKYGLRGYRFALMESGHLGQSLVTAATALGLCSLPWAGFADGAVDSALELDGIERSCLYLVSIARALESGP